MRLLDRLNAIQEQLAILGKEAFVSMIRNVIRYTVFSYKHPGFEEEREWRMIYTLDDGMSPYIRHEAVSVAGVPQIVCQVPLVDSEGLNMPELELSKVFTRILVGPCAYPDQVRMALLKAFDDQKAPLPRIELSNIPLRHA